MDITGIGTAANAVKDVLGMFLPDKTEEQRGQLALVLTAMQGQLDANKVEAASPSLFIGGWRPATGWVCVSALAMIYIPKAIFLCALWVYQAIVIVHGWNGTGPVPLLPAYPDLGVVDLIGLLTAMLGMGALRSQDKRDGTATSKLSPKAQPAAPPDQAGTPD